MKSNRGQQAVKKALAQRRSQCGRTLRSPGTPAARRAWEMMRGWKSALLPRKLLKMFVKTLSKDLAPEECSNMQDTSLFHLQCVVSPLWSGVGCTANIYNAYGKIKWTFSFMSSLFVYDRTSCPNSLSLRSSGWDCCPKVYFVLLCPFSESH